MRNTMPVYAVFSILVSLLILGCNTAAEQQEKAALRAALAQKIALDFRYYCKTTPAKNQRCTMPLTELPEELADMISRTNLGGVILFAENLVDIPQMVKLNYQLQSAALASSSKQPLFITVDQEGGRVARVPRHLSTPFIGSMGIGATYKAHDVAYAQKTGTVIGQELHALGFSVNHAPNVDVNVNPDNPVINVRSFGEDAKIVSILGNAQLIAMQQQGIIGTLKHFPGHGDTHVDSHTGLPRVEHTKEQIKAVDLAPFAYAIKQGNAHIIMTAHIQYPALDSSTFVAKSGKTMIKPATMSKTILTDLLRNDMGFNGLIITDALDMAGISEFFTPEQAVLETFKAGSDIALMPIAIRSPTDITRFDQLLDSLVDHVVAGELEPQHILQSVNRINSLKQSFNIAAWHQNPLDTLTAKATQTLANDNHKALEQALADDALVVYKGAERIVKTDRALMLVMPDKTKCNALETALKAQRTWQKLTCTTLYEVNENQSTDTFSEFDSLLIASISPNQSAAELGGMEDLKYLKEINMPLAQKQTKIAQLLRQAKAAGKETLFVSLRAPYEMTHYAENADILIATFGYNAHTELDSKGNLTAYGLSYSALARLLSGDIIASGSSPVTVAQ
ncbi:glycoside hydrolase family 3 N-terminal domain-containing protein [Thalassotalea agarivorans]|uniref:beta-N-acetylhexosaminidase n=1 Tax=Thalassotalea agarivorans TaxID=349064 RepID=A0A1I0CZG6_THASX|nr:glycoside hydrolase family 3 protein [Thalassotalea agarivorans]SET24883.1 beta-N-acetylhexosaminidase [Thalassotalea agarivorans]